jgi:capsular polysaccharide biosynthesis protein
MSNESHSTMQRYDDEIDLAELVAELWKRKWIIIGVTVACTILGVAYALSKEAIYEYSTTIQIGTRIVDDETRPIERPEAVAAKLESSYIPEAVRTYQDKIASNGDAFTSLQVSVDRPDDTNIVLLSSEGSEEGSRHYIPLHNRVVDHLIQDHERETELERVRLKNQLQKARQELERVTDERVLRVERDEITTRISAARNELEKLKDQAELINAELENLDVREELVRSRMEELAQFIEQGRKRRAQAQTEVTGGADSMALMLIDNELQGYIDRRTELEERLLVELPESRATLRTRLEENQRAQAMQSETIGALEARLQKLVLDQEREIPSAQAEVEEIRAQLDALRETRALLPPQRSLQPIGASAPLIVALSVILGGMLGVFLALGSMFAQSVRQRVA